ncbi:DUF6203 family protein [Streptosporangium minutum]|uniref:Uncharacterized protein n=1 Tax=Streptosporangium minutum TaxID=569862 RepID=A0A243QDZ2_9ACTN|nr:DUF6203 family protein [Streptosporangium minutum]OUC79952.1 hypothetical protein CA984_42725 [Streptosporangium minutum]
MKRILQLLATRWLARTPMGLVVVAVGWWLARRRRAGGPGERKDASRHPGRKSGNPYVWQGPSSRNRK